MSVLVQTVTGPVRLEALGATVTHEHIFLDSRDGFRPASDHIPPDLEVTPATRSQVDAFPLAVLDNLLLDDLDIAIEELLAARASGLGTLVEATSLFTGREPEQLVAAARASGVNIVMGSGLYLERAMPDHVRRLSEEELVELLETDVVEGVETRFGRVLPGVMGEVGVSAVPTQAERRSLRAAARVAFDRGIPLSIHLPAWDRVGHVVLDEIEAVVPALRGVLLGHLNPMAHDLEYLSGLAGRGAWLGLDMLGNGLNYGDGRKSPDEETNVENIVALVKGGVGDRLLLSSDVGQKNMLLRNGGQGYAYALRRILPALAERGIDRTFVQSICTANPARWFSEAAGPGANHFEN
jgi:phosphotriesterase-related protein